MSPTSKHSFVLCAALVATSSGEKTLEENDGSGLLQMQSPLATRRQQHTAATQLLQTAHAIIKKVNAGDDPADCSEASGAARQAVEAALPAIAEQHTHLTNQVLIAGNVVDACATREIDGLDMVSQQGTNLQTERSNHATCRQTENELEGGLGACDQFEELRNSLGTQQCFALPGEDEWILAVQNARDAMETVLNQGQPLEESCTNAQAALAAQQTECATAQLRFEEDYCAHRASCAELQICRATAEENYGLVVVEVQAALEVLHSEYQVMKHVECLLGMTDDALAQNSIISQEVIGSCSEPASTDELTIDYPVFSTLTTCESTILTRWPCDSAFFEAEYQSLAQRESIETACTECSALTTTSSLVVFDPDETELTVSAGSVTGSGSFDWNAPEGVLNSALEVTASSSICGVSFKCTSQMGNVRAGVASVQIADKDDCDHCISCYGTGGILHAKTIVFEPDLESVARSVATMPIPVYEHFTTDVHAVHINEGGQVQYSLNGDVYHTSETAQTYPWHVVVIARTDPSLSDVEYIQC